MLHELPIVTSSHLNHLEVCLLPRLLSFLQSTFRSPSLFLFLDSGSILAKMLRFYKVDEMPVTPTPPHHHCFRRHPLQRIYIYLENPTLVYLDVLWPQHLVLELLPASAALRRAMPTFLRMVSRSSGKARLMYVCQDIVEWCGIFSCNRLKIAALLIIWSTSTRCRA